MRTRTPDITAVCFTAEKNTDLDLDPASQREAARYSVVAVRHLKQVLMQFDVRSLQLQIDVLEFHDAWRVTMCVGNELGA